MILVFVAAVGLTIDCQGTNLPRSIQSFMDISFHPIFNSRNQLKIVVKVVHGRLVSLGKICSSNSNSNVDFLLFPIDFHYLEHRVR